MRRRFYAPPDAFAPDGASVLLTREETLHLRNVLRLRAGDEAFVFDGEGKEYVCVVVEADGRARSETTTLEVRGEVAAQQPESPLELTLAVALLKGEKFDLVVQKATELGVSRIVPVVTKRADVRLREGRDVTERTGRWRRLALEAAKQSGRARLPEVPAPVAFASLLANEATACGGQAQCLLFTERNGRGLAETLRAWETRPIKLTALIGPEGGWEPEEIAQGRAAGWHLVTLGGRILRAETAAIVVTGLLQHLYGDLV